MKRLLAKLFGNSSNTSRPSLTQRHKARLQLEGLEDRQLMSASPIAAPIAKPVLTSHALVQSVTGPPIQSGITRAQIQKNAATPHARAAPVSPMTIPAFREVCWAAYWWNRLKTYSYHNNQLIANALNSLRSLENGMEVLTQYEVYYEAYDYDGAKFTQYRQDFYRFYTGAVHTALYWWDVNNGTHYTG